MTGARSPETAGAATGQPRPARPEIGQELALDVDSLAHGGEGVARFGDGGYVVFVAGAIPGDRVKAVVTRRKRSYAHARAVEVLKESPQRIPPTADHPGVPWQVLPYERQLEIKRDQVEDALKRIGKLEGFDLEEVVPATQRWRYRNKLEYSFGELDGELVCGFHAPGGWRRVEPIDDCLLASERGNAARAAALDWCRGEGLHAWDRRRESIAGGGADAGRGVHRQVQLGAGAGGAPLLRNLVVRESRRTGVVQMRLVTTPGELDAGSLAQALVERLSERALSGVLWTQSAAPAETTLDGNTELVWGEAQLPERLGELDLRISPEAFFQTNTEMAEVLYGVAAEYAELRGWERVYDLYCGTGTIALTLAPRAGEVWGIEIVEPAVADAIAAAKRNGVTNARFFAGDARLALPELVERAGRPDVLVVDPPRAGLSQKVVRRILDAAPKRIVYVSCNPTTLAPNAAQMVQAGWCLKKVRPVDMFPQTPHIECVALLERG